MKACELLIGTAHAVHLKTRMQQQPSLVPRPFPCGRGERGEGRKGLVNNLTPT